MRVVIDLQGLQTSSSRHRGVGRYTENFVLNLLKFNTSHEFFLALNGAFIDTIEPIKQTFAQYIPRENIVIWQNFIRTAAHYNPTEAAVKSAEIIREIFLNSFYPDVIFSTNLQEGFADQAVTSVHAIESNAIYIANLHDLTPLYYKKDLLADPITAAWYYQKLMYAKNSDYLITATHAAKDDIINKLDVESKKILILDNGYDTNKFNNLPITASSGYDLLQQLGIHKPFILYLGGSEVYKNLKRLIIAYSNLPAAIKNKYNLVLAGKELPHNSTVQKHIKQLRLTNDVLTVGFIADNYLPLLLKSCLCFVFPSTHEGFGLPPLEAMACGVPVIGSNMHAVAEVIKEPQALFDPYDVASMTAKLLQVLSDEKMRNFLITQGLKNAKLYSWEKSAKQLLNFFDTLPQQKTASIRNYNSQAAIDAIAKLRHTTNACVLRTISNSIAETFCASRKNRLYVDVSSTINLDYTTGIQRVTRAISSMLLSFNDLDYDTMLVYSKCDGGNFYSTTSHKSVDFIQNDVLLLLDLSPGVLIFHADFITYLKSKGVKIYCLVYDILPIQKPQYFWPELCQQYRQWLDVVAITSGARCISKTVAQELQLYYTQSNINLPNDFTINYFHLGADMGHEMTHIDNKMTTLAINFLMVGTIEPRKGYKQTLAAFEQLWSEGIDVHLTIVGKIGWDMRDFVKALSHHTEAKKRLFWLEGATDDQLKNIYVQATCLIAASEGEGFGLPLVEAARYGTPIIARDIPVFREVAASNAFFFPDTQDPHKLKETIQQWMLLYQQGTHPTSSGLQWISWERSTKQLLSVILD